MKVFISWSGNKSKEFANVLRNWLPSAIQAIKPYFSPDDVDKGARWASEIANELENSDIGIICITRNNIEAPWLLFEAGALAKSIEKSRVIPLLFDLEPTDIKGPLAQFQASKFEEDDVYRLLKVINSALGENALEHKVLDAVFEKWWPELDDKVSKILKVNHEYENSGEIRSDREIIEEILENSRALLSDGGNNISKSWFDVIVTSDERILDQRIDILDLTARASNCLKANGIYYIGQLIQNNDADLLKIPNLGRKAYTEIKQELARYGLKLGLRLDGWVSPGEK